MKSPLIHLLLSILVALGVGVGYGFWYVTVADKSTEVASLETQITQATDNVKRIATARAALDEISNDESKIKSYFVPESSIVDFISDLQARGAANKATIEVTSVIQIKNTARPTLQFLLTIKGTFDAVMRTIGAIEYAPYDTSIASLSVVQTDQKIWQASMTLSVGSVAEPSTSTPPTKP